MNNYESFHWTKDHDEALLRMWNEDKKSFADIAAFFHISRNAVAGRINRLGVQAVRKRSEGTTRHIVRTSTVPPKPQANSWSNEHIMLVREIYFASTMTYDQIAERVGRTPAGVANLIKRRGWSKEREALQHSSHQRRPYNRQVAVQPPVSLGEPFYAPATTNIWVEGTHGISFEQLEHGDCRWPLGDDVKDMLYCGAGCLPNVSYCSGHVALAYRKWNKKAA
jgi:hypothetical protein